MAQEMEKLADALCQALSPTAGECEQINLRCAFRRYSTLYPFTLRRASPLLHALLSAIGEAVELGEDLAGEAAAPKQAAIPQFQWDSFCQLLEQALIDSGEGNTAKQLHAAAGNLHTALSNSPKDKQLLHIVAAVCRGMETLAAIDRGSEAASPAAVQVWEVRLTVGRYDCTYLVRTACPDEAKAAAIAAAKDKILQELDFEVLPLSEEIRSELSPNVLDALNRGEVYEYDIAT